MLAIAEGAAVTTLGGEVRRFLFEEFEELDSDWAHGNYFVESTAIWSIENPGGKGQDADESLIALADLIRLAALASLEAPLASPRLSIRYFGHGEGSRSRVIGPFERTLLIGDHSIATADADTLRHIGALADKWHDAGYSADHPALGALYAFGSVYTAFNARPELAMMPTMVALEGILAPESAPGIANRMATTLARLLPDSGLPDRMKHLYSIRSDIIHGRPLDQSAMDAAAEMGPIACRATIALIDMAIERHLPLDRWVEVLDPLA